MSQIHWGLIGCGDVARKRVADAIQSEPSSQLIAACRRNETELRAFCDAFSIERRYDVADALLADVDLDAVYLATPVREHLPHTLAAARAGKHVLVEKPMARSVAECNEMIAACRDAGVKLGVAYYRRYYPMVHRIQALVEEGAIGRPLAVSAVTATGAEMTPDREGYWRMVHEEGGGGALMDIGSHRINLFQHLFGEVIEVKAQCDLWDPTCQVETRATAVMTFRDGLTGTLQCFFGSRADPDEFTVIGTEGRLVAQPLNGHELMVEANGQKRVEMHAPPENLCGPLLVDFVTAILEDRPPQVTGEEGRLTNVVIERAYQSAGLRGA